LARTPQSLPTQIQLLQIKHVYLNLGLHFYFECVDSDMVSKDEPGRPVAFYLTLMKSEDKGNIHPILKL